MLTTIFFVISFSFIWLLLKVSSERRLKVASRVNALQDGSLYHTEQEDLMLEGSLFQRLFLPAWQWIISIASKKSPKGLKLEEQRRLARSGLSKITIGEWLAWRLISIVASTLIFSLMSLTFTGYTQWLLIAIGIIIGWYYPILYLRQKAAIRQKEITRSLPDVLDLLTVSVEAGLGFDAAMAKVVEKMDGSLAEEFGKTLQEIRMGKGRRDALRDLGRRTGNPDLIGFVSAIVQADQLGVSIGNVLRIQSEDLRDRRRTRAEEQAMKAPIKILFPLIFFIFPSIFVIILGPAVITMVNTFLK
jgi:tight adherence protein C